MWRGTETRDNFHSHDDFTSPWDISNRKYRVCRSGLVSDFSFQVQKQQVSCFACFGESRRGPPSSCRGPSLTSSLGLFSSRGSAFAGSKSNDLGSCASCGAKSSCRLYGDQACRRRLPCRTPLFLKTKLDKRKRRCALLANATSQTGTHRKQPINQHDDGKLKDAEEVSKKTVQR